MLNICLEEFWISTLTFSFFQTTLITYSLVLNVKQHPNKNE